MKIHRPRPRFGLALLLPTLVGVSVVVALNWLGTSSLLRRTARAHLAGTLPTISILLQPHLDRPGEELQAEVRALVASESTRITIIEESGIVIADSSRTSEELAQMDNHRQRPEIAGAFADGEGVSIRRSPTLDREFVYAAIRTQTPSGRRVVVRLSEPITAIEELRERLPVLMVVSLAAALLAMGFLAAWFYRNLFQPLGELVKQAEKVTPGHSAEVLPEPNAPEAAALTRAFNHLIQRAEEKVGELEAERSSLEAILSSLSDGVIVFDEEGRVVRWNPAAETLFGWERDPRGLSVAEVLPAREGQAIAARTLREREPSQLEIEIESTKRTLALLCSPIAESGGAVLTARDLTDALLLGQVRRDLVANVSHELKTPLAAIRGYAETLRDGAAEEPETRHRFISQIVQQCLRLQALLTDLLKLSRLEDKASLEDLGTVELESVIEEALEVIQPSAAAKSVEIRKNLRAVHLENASREALAELCLNLFDNGIKYNREGGILSVGLDLDTSKDQVRLTVQDTGRGLPDASRQRIFERFYRVDRGRGRSEGGTGLGLAIVKHAVERHGGEIQVTSELGRGTTFVVSLPRSGPRPN